MEEFVLSLEELMVYLNILYHSGNDEIAVYSYFLEDELFHISLADTVQIKRLIEPHVYQEKYLDLLNSVEAGEENSVPKREPNSTIIPPFKILRKCLVGSGLWELKNWDQFKSKLDEIERSNPLRGDRVTFIGFDTNCFINRLFSCLKHEYKRNISRFGFILSRLIHMELRSTQKISSKELNFLKGKVNRNKEILDEFWNQDSLYTRLKMVGLVEFNKVKRQSNYLINDGVRRNGRDNDVQIIEDLRNQSREKNADLVMATSDEQFHRIAREPGIVSYYLRLPPLTEMPQESSATWEQFCDFLYLLSVYFGAIILRSRNTFQLFGIWLGKSTTAWDTESLKIQIRSPKLARLLNQQLQILTPS